MAKNLLVIPLLLAGLIVGVIGVSAQGTQEIPIGLPGRNQGNPSNTASSFLFVEPSTISEVNLSPGTRSSHVKKVQEALKALGYLPLDLETTEYLGSKTREAIINFQRDRGIPTTGFFGPTTRTALKKNLQEGGAVIDKNVDIACMKVAVEKRENALLAGWDTYAGKIKTARETRKADLLAAWSIQDPTQRHVAIKAAWEKYRQNVKTARTEWNRSRKTTWTQFAQDAKNCRASVVETQDMEIVEVQEE